MGSWPDAVTGLPADRVSESHGDPLHSRIPHDLRGGGEPSCGGGHSGAISWRHGKSDYRHGAGRPGGVGVGSSHLLLRGSDACKGGGGARVPLVLRSAASYRLTSPPSRKETTGAEDVARRSPPTVTAGLLRVAHRPIRTEPVPTVRCIPHASQEAVSTHCRGPISCQLSAGVAGSI